MALFSRRRRTTVVAMAQPRRRRRRITKKGMGIGMILLLIGGGVFAIWKFGLFDKLFSSKKTDNNATTSTP